ncbi:MAG: MBL fold metallo-hydrolase [Acidobacteria bacterium]|nr:MAG: MBL fold metallo-hydrolase [Acidobacteriota bacterium]
MSTTQIAEGLWQIGLGPVNAFLLDSLDSARDKQGELTLIDTGVAKSEEKIVAAIESIGRKATDLKHIIVTHCHPDHSGSLAAMKRKTGAVAYMHRDDAAMVRRGEGKRPMTAAPGLMRKVFFTLFVSFSSGKIEPAVIDREIDDGTELPIAGGLKAIHVPGHCAGQLAFLWPRRRVLFAADACSNMMGLGYSLGYEDFALGQRALSKLVAFDFDAAVFGHGAPITSGAAQKFRQTFAS